MFRWFLNLHPVTKLLTMLWLTTISTLFTSPIYLFGSLIIALLFYSLAANATPLRHSLIGRSPYLLILVGSAVLILFNAAFASVNVSSRYILFAIPIAGQHYDVSLDGLYFGLGAGFRYTTMLLALLGFLSSTYPRDFANALEQANCPTTVSNMFALTFRFIPIMRQLVFALWEAQRSRGLVRNRRRKITLKKVYGTLAKNLLLSTIWTAKRYSIVLEVRGFDSSRRRTHWRKYNFARGDQLLTALLIITAAIAVYVRIYLKLGLFRPLS
jgi:energy-coupling factor transporter transmembrane protein EcfT